MKRVTIIDANNYGHKAFHTVGSLSYKGIATGVIYGVLNQLFYTCADVKTDVIVFCWDGPKSKRRERFPFYKNRPEKPQAERDQMKEAFYQFDLLRKYVLPEMGFINNFWQSGYEADDLIASIVKNNPDCFHTICSGDEDLFQLLSTNCQIYSSKKGGIYTKPNFMKEYKIHPQKWIDVKKLAGCKSDTIPGINGIGEKRAIAYLTKKMNPNSAFYKKIQQQKHLVEEHEWLIKLPLPGTCIPDIQPTHLNGTGFKEICKSFGFTKFNLTEWELVFWNELETA